MNQFMCGFLGAILASFGWVVFDMIRNELRKKAAFKHLKPLISTASKTIEEIESSMEGRLVRTKTAEIIDKCADIEQQARKLMWEAIDNKFPELDTDGSHVEKMDDGWKLIGARVKPANEAKNG